MSAFSAIANIIGSQMAADQQYKRQLEFWDLQNDYNTPFSQRQRLQVAGLNPGDNVQSIPAGELSSVPRNEALAGGAFNLDLIGAIKTLSETEKIGAETDLISQQLSIAVVEEALKRGELLGVQLDNQKRQILLKWLDAKEKASLDKLYADIRNLDQSTATSASQQDLNTATAESLRTKLPYEVDSLVAGTQLKREQSLSESFKREYYLAGSENQRSMAVKNYAEARLLDVKTSIESVYGALQAEANLTKTQLESSVIVPLADSLIALQESMEMLNKDTIRHNEVIENIQKDANTIQKSLVMLKQNQFYYSMFKDAADAMTVDVENLLNAIAGLL